MKIENSVVFVTGGNRGLGLAFAREALSRGARKVYAGMRRTDGFDVPKLTPPDVAGRTLDALAAGKDEVLADEGTRVLKAGLSRERPSYIDPEAR